MEEIEDQIILSVPEKRQEESIIKVIGIGGGGSNAVNHMFNQGIRGVEFVVCNTDIQALRQSRVKNRIQLGKELTEGRGAGCVPERGKQSAIESMDYVKQILERNTRMVFITAGMGGGTGTGAAPEIAKQAQELGILTIGIVTVPFHFEGRRKVEQAMKGIDELEQYVDALLIIANERLRDMYGNLKLSEAFAKADDVLTIAAKSIAEIITVKGYVNVDFADVEGVMRNSGVALMGAAEVEGEDRATKALEQALISPLLESAEIQGASDILLNILYGDKEVTMNEIDVIIENIREKVGRSVNVIWGTGEDRSLGEKLRVAVIATGFHSKRNQVGCGMEKKENPTFVRKTSFKVEELPAELELKVENSVEMERDARIRRSRQEDERRRKEVRRAERFQEETISKGVNELPDTNNWLKRKIGTLFSEEE